MVCGERMSLAQLSPSLSSFFLHNSFSWTPKINRRTPKVFQRTPKDPRISQKVLWKNRRIIRRTQKYQKDAKVPEGPKSTIRTQKLPLIWKEFLVDIKSRPRTSGPPNDFKSPLINLVNLLKGPTSNALKNLLCLNMEPRPAKSRKIKIHQIWMVGRFQRFLDSVHMQFWNI